MDPSLLESHPTGTLPEIDFTPYLYQIPEGTPDALRREWLDPNDSRPSGRLLPHGTWVLRNPARPNEFKADTPTHRTLFRNRWLTWSASALDQVGRQCLIDHGLTDSRTRGLLPTLFHGVQSQMVPRVDAIEANLLAAVGQPFPPIHGEPSDWRTALDLPVRILSVSSVTDLTDRLLNAFEEFHRPKDQTPWPLPWRAAWKEVNRLQVHRVLGSGGRRIHVVVGCVVPISFQQDPKTGQPIIVTLPWDLRLLDLCRSAIESPENEPSEPCPRHTFVSIGSTASSDELLEAPAGYGAPAYSFILWGSQHPSTSSLTTISSRGNRHALRDFTDLLLPQTEIERCRQVQEHVDRLLDFDQPGSITVQSVVTATGLEPRHVRRAFLFLQQDCPNRYVLRKGRGPESDYHSLVIARRNSGDRNTVGWEILKPRWWRRQLTWTLLLVIPAFLVAGLGYWKDQIRPGLMGSLVWAAGIALASALTRKWIERGNPRD